MGAAHAVAFGGNCVPDVQGQQLPLSFSGYPLTITPDVLPPAAVLGGASREGQSCRLIQSFRDGLVVKEIRTQPVTTAEEP